MKYDLKFLNPASLELSEAFLWYENKKLGLGVEFIDEIDYYLNLIQ